MKINRRTTWLAASLAILAVLLAGCAAKNVVVKMSQADFNKQKFLCQDLGLVVDFQPSRILCAGEYEGEKVIIEMVAQVEDGKGLFQIVRYTLGEQDMTAQELADLNAAMKEELYIYPNEKYVVTSLEITPDELILTSAKK